MNKDQVKGRIRVARGKAKEVAGKLLHKPSLTVKGRLQEAAGTVQAAYGDVKSSASKRAASAKRTLRKKGRAVKKRVASKAK
jgi:uncharacterized protein YjbJ (UPF0337 family)